MAVKACLNGGREREQHFALGQSPLELAVGSGRPERVVDVGAADAFDADQLVPRTLAAQDADLRAPDAEAACNQPAQRLVCPPLERGRADARHQHAIAETDDLIAASARLSTYCNDRLARAHVSWAAPAQVRAWSFCE